MTESTYIVVPHTLVWSDFWITLGINEKLTWFVLMLLADTDGVFRGGEAGLAKTVGCSLSEARESVRLLKASECKYGHIADHEEGILIPWYAKMREKLESIEFFEKNLKAITSGLDYRSRQYWLGKIGFTKYSDYLRSPLWNGIRDRIDMTQCSCCDRPASQVHHSRYHKNDLLGKTTKHLHPICGVCHQAIEYHPDGSKRTMVEANDEMRRKPVNPS